MFFVAMVTLIIGINGYRNSENTPTHIKLTDHGITGYNEIGKELLEFQWEEIVRIRRNNFFFESQGSYLISNQQENEFYIGYFIKGYNELLAIIKEKAPNLQASGQGDGSP